MCTVAAVLKKKYGDHHNIKKYNLLKLNLQAKLINFITECTDAQDSLTHQRLTFSAENSTEKFLSLFL